MSRGYGQLQQFIIDKVGEHPTEVHPTPVLAALYAQREGIEETKHLRASVRRAVIKLADEGILEIDELSLPTRMVEDGNGNEKPLGWRYVLCCWAPGLDVQPGSDKHVAAATMFPVFTAPPTK